MKLSYYYIILLATLCSCSPKEETIIIDNWKITISDSDEFSYDDYYSNQDVIDSLTRKYANWHQRYMHIEKHQIQESNTEIQIDSTSRIVTLKNGSNITLTPDPTIDEISYSFVKEFPEYDLLLFRVQWYEGDNYFLLNLTTGEKTYIIGKPYFSESGKYIMSINSDLEAGYSYNGFQLLKIEEDHISELWKFDPGWAPEKFQWINDTSFYVHGYKFTEENGILKTQELNKKIRLYENGMIIKAE